MAEKAPAKKRPAPRQQMLEALAESSREVDERREAEARPEARIEARATQEAVAAADALSTEGVVKSVVELKSALGKTLTQLSDRLEEEVAKYVQIQRAIVTKTNELKEIYEIQKSATSLVALLETQQKKRDEFEEEMTEETSRLERDIETARAQWEAERKQREADQKERDATELKRRQREQEEYRYASTREQQLAKDQFADEMAKSEKALADRQSQMEKELSDRERAVASREEEVASLRQRVDAIPRDTEAAVTKAVKEALLRQTQESTAREELLKREFAGERNVLTTRITSLEQTAKEQSEQITRLLQQAEKAYGQVQEIAVRAIEGSAGQKSLANLQQLLVEQGRKQGAEK